VRVLTKARHQPGVRASEYADFEPARATGLEHDILIVARLLDFEDTFPILAMPSRVTVAPPTISLRLRSKTYRRLDQEHAENYTYTPGG
jgi:hypothetical protein